MVLEVLNAGLDIPFVKETVASIVGVGTFAYTCYRFGRRAGNAEDKDKIASLSTQLNTVEADSERVTTRLKMLEDTVRDPQDFWLRTVDANTFSSHQEAIATSIPIVCVVNFKGGVGKTTI